MNFVVLDLEWTPSFSKKQKKYVNEIIEFGAVKLDRELKTAAEFSMLVMPNVGKKLNPKIEELTHITMEDLTAAHNSFAYALSKFSKFAEGCVLLTWSTTDIITLLENKKYFAPDRRLSFIKYYCNVQAYCEQALNMQDTSKQLALTACCEQLGVKCDESKHHRALEDARMTAECFRRLYDPSKLRGFIMKADDEFYARLAFRSHFVISEQLHNSYAPNLVFNCPRCGERLTAVERWTIKNHSFRTALHCCGCGGDFVGTATYKAKYDGITVKHKVIDVSTPPQLPAEPDKVGAADE